MTDIPVGARAFGGDVLCTGSGGARSATRPGLRHARLPRTLVRFHIPGRLCVPQITATAVRKRREIHITLSLRRG